MSYRFSSVKTSNIDDWLDSVMTFPLGTEVPTTGSWIWHSKGIWFSQQLSLDIAWIYGRPSQSYGI